MLNFELSSGSKKSSDFSADMLERPLILHKPSVEKSSRAEVKAEFLVSFAFAMVEEREFDSGASLEIPVESSSM